MQVRSLALHRGLKDPALPQLWHRLQLCLRNEPWPRNLICFGVAKKKKKKEGEGEGEEGEGEGGGEGGEGEGEEGGSLRY